MRATCLVLSSSLLCLGACAAPSGPTLASEVIAAPGASLEGTHDPSRATNGVRGAGMGAGSLDVYSLGAAGDAWMVLGFDGASFPDGEGAELAVFENPFLIGRGPFRFMDPLVVEVSRDGTTFVAFPHAYLAREPSEWSANPQDWEGFAGIGPVLLHEEDAPGDPFDPLAAGGDQFDLADLPGPEGDAIRAEGFRYVRLISARLEIDERTGSPFPHDPASDGPDVDGVYARSAF